MSGNVFCAVLFQAGVRSFPCLGTSPSPTLGGDMKSRLFLLSGLGLLLAATLLLSACGRSDSPSKSSDGVKPLVVGMELAYPPFEMMDEQKRPCGVGVEMVYALGQHLERPVEIENIPFTGLILALKGGRVDLVVASMTATEERAKSIDFSDPYVRTGLGILVPKASTVQSVADLDQAGRKVAVKRGTTGHTYAMEHLKNAEVLVMESSAPAVMEVSQGKTDAFIYDQLSIYQNWKKYPDSTRALLTPFQRESWAIGLRKGNDELRGQVNAFLKDFRQRGGFEQLGDKYMKELKAAFKEQGIEFVF